jgi:hypothetical protein
MQGHNSFPRARVESGYVLNSLMFVSVFFALRNLWAVQARFDPKSTMESKSDWNLPKEISVFQYRTVYPLLLFFNLTPQ